MKAKVTLYKICCWACFVAVFCASCNTAALDNLRGVEKSKDTLYYLDNIKPTVEQPIEPKKGEVFEAYKFVQVEVTEVSNPKRFALSFEVSYRSKDRANNYLGSFSLYPADNPGKFIVATQGKLKNEGAIILTMVIQDKIGPGDTIKATVKKMKFLKDN
jgi:hypothetical protein